MGKLRQCYTALACSFGSLVMGLVNSWASYSQKLYTAPNSTVVTRPMTEFEESLLGSLPSLGAMAGTAVVGAMIDRIGRQKGGVVLSLPFVLSWAMIDQSTSPVVVLIARFLGGISGGAFLVYAPMFISEVADDSIRGALASGPILLYCLGALVSYILGWRLTHQHILWTNLMLSVLCGFLCLMVVESPLYLLRQNREEDAAIAISKYRSASPSSKEVLEELSRMRAQINPPVELVSVTEDTVNNDDKKYNKENGEKEKTDPEKEKLNSFADNNVTGDFEKVSSYKMLMLSASRRAFLVVFTVLSLQVFMGMVPVMVYAEKLFKVAAPSWSPHFCSVLLAVCVTLGSLVVTLVADIAGRRVVLISSSALVAVCMASLGLVLQTGLAPPWVGAVIILVYSFAFTLGAGSVPYILLAEVFVAEVQGLASMLLVEWSWLMNFLILLVFPTWSSWLGIHGMFYCFAAVAVGNTLYGVFCLPETKGLSNQEIQEKFRK